MNIIQYNENNRGKFKLFEAISLEIHRTTLSLFDKLKSKEADDSVEILQEDISKIVKFIMVSEIILKKLTPNNQ